MMGSSSLLDHSNSIQTHGTKVGVLFVLFAFIEFLNTLVLYLNDYVLPEDLKKINGIKVFFLVLCCVKTFIAGFYWIGFVKRIRWCLTFVIAVLVVSITLQLILLFIAFLDPNTINMTISIAITGYQLLVTLHLRKSISEFTALQNECVNVSAL